MTDTALARALDGDIAAAARLISQIEAHGALSPAAMDELCRRSGRARVIGVTGPPGAGKSTLVNGLLATVRVAGGRAAVLAVDPSSQVSGGAVLGDRVRMAREIARSGAFVRSMASRGHLGGLALAAPAAIRLLDAMGMDVILVETVGVGQSEVDVAAATDCVVLVVAPGAGDEVQAMKAGVLEVARIIVVNKADLPGAEQTRAQLGRALRQRGAGTGPPPKILLAAAEEGVGVAEVAALIHQLLDEDGASGALAERRLGRLRDEAIRRAGYKAQERTIAHARAHIDEALVADLAQRRRDPIGVADAIVERLFAGSPQEPVPARPAPGSRDGEPPYGPQSA